MHIKLLRNKSKIILITNRPLIVVWTRTYVKVVALALCLRMSNMNLLVQQCLLLDSESSADRVLDAG